MPKVPAWVRPRVAITGVVIALVVGLSACGGDSPGSAPLPSYTPTGRSPSSSSASAPDSEATTSAEPGRNDFEKLPLRRSIDSAALTVDVDYRTRLPVEEWQSSVPKPVQVSLTAVNRRNRNQNVYLLRATAEVTAAGDNGFVERPVAVVDIANIVPGFIVKAPSTYNQVFNLPATDASATQLTVDFTYEFVIQVSEQREFGDYSKQVATDTIVVPLVP